MPTVPANREEIIRIWRERPRGDMNRFRETLGHTRAQFHHHPLPPRKTALQGGIARKTLVQRRLFHKREAIFSGDPKGERVRMLSAEKTAIRPMGRAARIRRTDRHTAGRFDILSAHGAQCEFILRLGDALTIRHTGYRLFDNNHMGRGAEALRAGLIDTANEIRVNEDVARQGEFCRASIIMQGPGAGPHRQFHRPGRFDGGRQQ